MEQKMKGHYSCLGLFLGIVCCMLFSGCPSDVDTIQQCGPNQLHCDDTCIDPKTDRFYCGSSGNCTGSSAGVACEDGYVCNGAGSCELTCQAGLIDCNSICIDPKTDRSFCGASGGCSGGTEGVACEAGYVCQDGLCTLSCQSGFVICDDVCINPDTDDAYCGAQGDCKDANAGVVCSVRLKCVDGACQLPAPKSCEEINHQNGYNVIIEPGKVLLGPDANHAVRCQQISETKIRIYEVDYNDCLRFDNVGIFNGRGEYEQSIRDDLRNIARMCNHLGYLDYAGANTNVNSSKEVLVDADMGGFVELPAGDDWQWFECFN